MAARFTLYGMRITRTLTGAAIATAAFGSVLGGAQASAADYIAFQSPTGNIACSISITDDNSGEIRCDVKDATFDKPTVDPERVTANCGGRTLRMKTESAAQWSCASDTLIGAGYVLQYGEHAKSGHLECESMTDGMHCYTPGHKFRIARESWDIDQ